MMKAGGQTLALAVGPLVLAGPVGGVIAVAALATIATCWVASAESDSKRGRR